MELQTFTCPNCGKSLEANPNLDTIMCNACGTYFTPDMDTAKLAIHKISGIVNKAMDKKEAEKIRREEYAKQQAKNWNISFAIYMIILFIIMIICFKAGGVF